MSRSTIIAIAKQTIKNVNNNMREGNREYHSLSSVLKDVQRKQYMEAGYAEVFAAVGMPEDGRVTPAMFFAVCNSDQWGQTINKKGEKVGEPWIGIWGTQQKKEKDGTKVVDENGNPVMEEVLRKVTAWTPTKLFTVLSQAQAYKSSK